MGTSSFVIRRSSFGILLLLVLLVPSLGRAQGEPEPPPNRAGLVIRHGDGRVVTACVGFAEPSISGLELLQRAGVPFLAQQGGIGAAVCQIDGEGCAYPSEDCFCKRDGPRTIYWAYNRLTVNGWALAPLGASGTRVQPGDVEGWAWGSGSVDSGAQPPAVSFADVCQADAATAQPPEPTNDDRRMTNVPVPPAPTVNDERQVAPKPQDAPSSYVAFGTLALLLIGGIIVVALRRRA